MEFTLRQTIVKYSSSPNDSFMLKDFLYLQEPTNNLTDEIDVVDKFS